MILFVGPYVGSFEYEITVFLPYVLWLSKVVPYEKIYLSTHFNRYFLYKNFVDENNFIPIYRHLTRDEGNQEEHRHNKVSVKDYNFITKDLSSEIIKRESIRKCDLSNINLGYTKNINNDSIYKKIFESIDIVDVPDDLKNLLIFIPFGNNKKSEKIYKYLKSEVDSNFVVIGDLLSPLINDNIILKNVNYFEKGLEYIIGAITYARIVVCPLSYWTFLCNLQKAKVFSWGDNPGRFRKDCGGIYSFGNDKSFILPEIKMKNLLYYLKDFIK
jgi:hypothetical protein